MTLVFFLLGAIMASFIGCLATRSLTGESILYPASHCDGCRRKLNSCEKIPLLGYILTRGRCDCGYKIGIELFVSELLLAIIYAIYFKFYGFSLDFLAYAVLYGLLAKASLTDLWTYHAHERDLALILIFGLVAQLRNFIQGDFYILVGAGQVFFMFLYFYLDRQEKVLIGEGDVLVYAGLFSFFTPIQSFYFFALAHWMALGPALYKRFKGGSYVPMIPFISLSFFIIEMIGRLA